MARGMKGILTGAALAAVIGSVACGRAGAEGFDPFSVHWQVSRSPARAMEARESTPADPCQFGQPGPKVGLIEVVERALCHNPRTRYAWANAKVQAAVLGVRESAYLPTVSAGLAYGKQRNKTEYADVGGYPFSSLDSDSSPVVRSGSLKMSWVLSDFGLRGSRVDEARAMLEAANATHDATIQAAFVEAAREFTQAEITASVPELNELHEVVYPLWHSAYPDRDFELIKSLLPRMDSLTALLDAAPLPGILREKQAAWDERKANLASALLGLHAATESGNHEEMLKQVEAFHAGYEQLVRTIRPLVKELDAYHQELYKLYHYYGPQYDLPQIQASAAVSSS